MSEPLSDEDRGRIEKALATHLGTKCDGDCGSTPGAGCTASDLRRALAEVDRLKAKPVEAGKATANYGATGTATLREVMPDAE